MVDHNEVFFEMRTEEIYRIFSEKRCRIVTDSRKVGKGDIFFALKGENHDGNRFASDALARGAVLAVIDDPAYKQEGTIITGDVLAELQSVATRHRKSLYMPLLAITGTNGKTTTKELITRVLSSKFKVHSTGGNMNNHIGVPLTILSSPPDTGFMVIEMGANHLGEIKLLCEIAKPEYGIITNIDKAHLEGFGSIDGVRQAKSELYRYLAANYRIAFINPLNKLLEEVAGETDVSTVPYDHIPPYGIIVRSYASDPLLSITLAINGIESVLHTNLFGEHNVENIMAAIAVGLYFGVDERSVLDAIAKYIPENNRSQLVKTERNSLVCDSYNANPESMKRSIDAFFKATGEPRTVILGDMYELGKYSDQEHRAIVDHLISAGPATLYLVGPRFCSAAEGSGIRGFNDVNELENYLSGNPIKDNFVLVKGSRAVKLEQLYPVL